MVQTGRAPFEVAKHFCEKYGRDHAHEIIVACLGPNPQQHDTQFWQEVLKLIDDLKNPSMGAEVMSRSPKAKKHSTSNMPAGSKNL